jgi:formamidopyrimidine-DNA glycosylase
MPEGPEVEVVRRELLQLIDKRIEKIQLTPLSQKYPKYKGLQTKYNQFNKKSILEIQRYGKFLIWQFTDIKAVILNHLGMSGKWCLFMKINYLPGSVTHPKIIIEFENPPHIAFDDVRNFGQFRIFPSLDEALQYTPIRTLGLDGLAQPFPLEDFLERLSFKRYENKPIGELLLNQRLVAGVGNIYKSESLFLARIHPQRKVKTLSQEEKTSLGKAISETLQKALVHGGSTFGTQPYSRPSGDEGEAQQWHNVYNRKGESCVICDSVIQRSTQKNRSTFFCTKCQK